MKSVFIGIVLSCAMYPPSYGHVFNAEDCSALARDTKSFVHLRDTRIPLDVVIKRARDIGNIVKGSKYSYIQDVDDIYYVLGVIRLVYASPATDGEDASEYVRAMCWKNTKSYI